MVRNNGGFRAGQVVVLGGHRSQEVIMESIEGIRRYFLMYAVCEMGSIPPNSPRITHLVTPLSYYCPGYIQYMVRALLACLPCFFGPPEDFEGGSEVESVSKVDSEVRNDVG